MGKTKEILSRYRGYDSCSALRMDITPSNIKYADRLRSEILNAIERGTFSYADYFPQSQMAKRFGHVKTDITIGELLATFLDQIKTTRENSTFIGYKKVCEAHLIPYFGRVTIQHLKPAFIREWIRGLDVTSKTVSNLLIPLRAVIEQSLNDEYIKSNPLDKIVISKLLSKKTSQSNFKVDPFDRNEIKAILEATHHEQIKNLFQFAFFTGLRTSELITLEWEDVDLTNGIIHVCRAVVKKQIKGTKTFAGNRTVMLLPPAIAAINAQKKFTFKNEKRVFHNPRTNQPWETDHKIRRTAWIHTMKKARVRYRNPYQTRHTYASMMLSGGENIMWVASQMGHVDTEMVMRTYGKWIPDDSSKKGYQPVSNWGAYIDMKKDE
ncbi:MAG: tyrosine-type recombinase/integrase [Legionellaceae bacterium]|nr:tyrosine-type recombinase/integrase [Legionellaceae bacterium]